MIGSRDAERAPGDGRRARRARRGRDERGRGPRRRSRRARGQGGRRARHRARDRGRARRDAAALGRERAAVLEGRRAPRPRRALARRAGPGARRRRRSSRACTRSRPRTSRPSRPTRTRFVCGDDAGAKALALELAAKLVAGRALDAGPLASARTLEGLTAVIVNLNRRYKAHAGIRVTGVCRDLDRPGRGPARDRGGRRPRRADRRRASSSRTATSSWSRRRPSRRPRAASCGSRTSRPSPQARELAGRRATRASSRSSSRETARIVRARPPFMIAETRHGFVCASAGVDHSNAPEPGTVVLLPLDPDASARRIRDATPRAHRPRGRR